MEIFDYVTSRKMLDTRDKENLKFMYQ